jgi:thioredoxin-like negative regulator of GroEL
MFQAFDFTATIDEMPVTEIGSFSKESRIAPEDLKCLTEIGVLALARERGDAARPIFELLDVEQPDNAAGPIGLAMIEVAQGNDRAAFARLRRAIIERNRCISEAKAVLCVFLMGFGRAAEAKSLRRDLLRGPDCGARRLVASYC